MYRQPLDVVVTLLLVCVLAGCDSSPSSSPVAPSAVVQTAPQSTALQSVAGFVIDTAFRPVPGARVEVLDGPQAGVSVIADAMGQFSLPGPSPITFRATKEGHVAATQVSRTSAPGGRPWVVLHLEVLAPPVNIAGSYTLTFIADSACVDLPNELRTRTYAASIALAPTPDTRGDTLLEATVSGASFLGNYETFRIGVAGDYVSFAIGSEGPGLAEQVGPNTYLSFYGWAEASVETSGPSTISTSFDGLIEYCALKSEMGQIYNCTASQAVAHARCESKNHRLILTRH